MLLRVRDVCKPGEDDLRSSTMIQAEAKLPRNDWAPLVGPVLAAFLVEKGSGETSEQDALTQYLYWCKLKSEEVRPTIDISRSSDPKLQKEIDRVEEQRTALEQRFPMGQVSAYADGTQAREREESESQNWSICMLTKRTDVHKRDL